MGLLTPLRCADAIVSGTHETKRIASDLLHDHTRAN
jgi:hypothetical protein